MEQEVLRTLCQLELTDTLYSLRLADVASLQRVCKTIYKTIPPISPLAIFTITDDNTIPVLFLKKVTGTIYDNGIVTYWLEYVSDEIAKRMPSYIKRRYTLTAVNRGKTWMKWYCPYCTYDIGATSCIICCTSCCLGSVFVCSTCYDEALRTGMCLNNHKCWTYY